MTKKMVLLAFAFMGFQSAQGQSTDLSSGCSEYYRKSGYYDYYRQDAGFGICYLNINPSEAHEELVYRSYLLAQDGLFMVFNSYGDGPISSFTGARVFYFFPRNQLPNAEHSTTVVKAQSASSKVQFSFDAASGKLMSLTGGTVKEDKQVSRNNQGGIEFSNVQHLYLDLGFAVGHDPTTEMDRVVFFQDENQVQCKLKVREIFQIQADGDSTWIYPNDSSLKKFLQTRCPELSLLSLSKSE